MSATPPHIRQAAHAAATRIEQLLVDMLLAGDCGEVAVVVSYSHLEPVKRVVEKKKAIRLARGHFVAVTPSE